MSTSSRHKTAAGGPELDSETLIGESPTRLVRQLLMRGGETRKAITEGEDGTNTLSVMLRLQPPPRSLLVVSAARRGRLNTALTDAGFDSLVATTTHQAIETLAEETHSLAVTDRLDVVSRLRALGLRRLLQIMLICEHPDWEAAQRAGADDCIEDHAPEAQLRARLIAARRMSDLESALRASLIEGRRLATTDELTKVANKRFFAAHYPRELARSARYGHPMAVAMCDIDHFKRINDRHGHAAGDEILCQCAQRMQQCLGQSGDWIARLGGDEFAVVMPETNLDAAMLFCRKVRQAISAAPFRCGATQLSITASLGVAAVESVAPNSGGLAERLLSVADRVLYRCKEMGRDRVAGARVSSAPS
jgi:two-component system, cell cycle response regulator